MSLPLVSAILVSIALAIDLTEASPTQLKIIEKRSISFSNSESTTKKSSSTKKTSTTKKASTPTKAASQSKTASISTAPSLVSSSSVKPIIIPSSSNVLIVATSGTSSSIAASASSSPAQSNSKSSGGLSGGAIGAIVAVIVIIIVGVGAYLCISKRRKNKASRTKAIAKPDPFTMGFGSDGGFHAQTYNSQPPKPPNHQIQTNSYQPDITVASPNPSNSPYYSNSASNTQFHDANNHIIASSMMPAIVPQMQYQPQLQPQPGSGNHLPNTSVPPRMSPTQAGSLGVFFVVATYTPTLSDEIDIQLNDQVELLVEYDDGWCQGINLTRGHAKGVFPKHCIENSNDGTNIGDVDRLKRVSSMYMG